MAGERSALRGLTVDLGNTRCKVRVWEGGRCQARGDFEGLARLPERVGSWLAGNGAIEWAFVSSVASPQLAERVIGVVRSLVRTLCEAPDPGLENLCRVPSQVGLDRLYGARGALELLGSSAIVVDLGTALTVDAVLHRPGERGSFLGGAIAPGPELQARSLAEGAARLPLVEPIAGPPPLGRDTEQAIRSGIGEGLRGAARSLVEGVARQAGLEEAPVVLTGGARRFLLEPHAFTDRPLREEAELVHRGLFIAGLEAVGSPAPWG